MFTDKQAEIYDNVLNVIANLTTWHNIHSYCRLDYDDISYLTSYTDKFCRNLNTKFYDIDILKDGLQFNEVLVSDNNSNDFKKPNWFLNDGITYVLIYNIDLLSIRSLAYKQLEILIKQNKIRSYEVPKNIHFIFVGKCETLPIASITNIDL